MEPTAEPTPGRTSQPLRGTIPLWAIVVVMVALQVAVVVAVPALLRSAETPSGR